MFLNCFYLFYTDKWQNETEYIQTLSGDRRRHFKKKILDKKAFFQINIVEGTQIDSEKVEMYHKMYFNVKQKSYNLNTFDLPILFFKKVLQNSNWEIIELTCAFENEQKISSFGICYRSANNYIPLVIGIDYELNKIHNGYRQNIYQVIKRGKNLGVKKIFLGMDASLEKTRMGAKSIKKAVYIQAQDNYNMELLSLINVKKQ